MQTRSLAFVTAVVFTTLVVGLCVLHGQSDDPKYRTLTNAQVQTMLDQVLTDIKENYYVANFNGVDVDKKFQQERQKIASAKTQDEAMLSLAAAVEALDDSHTHFKPPTKPYGVDYGWTMEAIGESASYVTHVRPEADAAAKGLKAGDQIVSVNGIPLTRADIERLEYVYNVIPQSGLHLTTRSLDGSEKNLVVMAKVTPGQKMVTRSEYMAWRRTKQYRQQWADRSKYYGLNKQVLFWKLPDFVVKPDDVNGMLNKTRSFQSVVLDLRGNPGGYAPSLDKFVAGFFDHDVKLGDRKGRKESTPEIAKSRGGKAFTGRLIVLVDSKSASAAEIFARTMQLEKRATVLGDRSSGRVMEAKTITHAIPLDRLTVTQYGVSVSIADLIMTDGKSLEKTGVMPDELILPTPADLAAARDPVLARAAALAGISMTPEEAAKIFPFEWPSERMPEID